MESITRAEVDVQIATAHKFPRSLAQFYKRAEAMVTVDEETAASCLYKLTRYDKEKGEHKIIEGESVRMAEIVAACYGNLRSAVQISGHSATRVSVRAVCHDLEVNNLIAVEKQAKTAYKDGRPYNEDLAIMIANATVSKALRDAIFRVVPKALIKPLKEKARLVALGNAATVKTRIDKAMQWVTSLKIDKARVFAVLNVKGVEDIGIDQLEVLTGLRTAIKDGDQTAEEAFPPLEAASSPFTAPESNPKLPPKEEQKTETKTETKAETKQETKVKKEPKKDPTPPTTQAPPVATEPPTPVKEETKPENVVTAPIEKTEPPATTSPAEDEKQLAGMGLAPDADQSEQLFKDIPQEQPPLTEGQLQIKERFEAAGLTIEDLSGWGKGKIFTPEKLPKTWGDISPVHTANLIKSIKGVVAGVKTWKGSK